MSRTTVSRGKFEEGERTASGPSWGGHALNLAIGAITITLALSWLQSSQGGICCGDFDGYYHIKWSRMLWEGLRHGHLAQFTWLPLTTLNASQYADQHFLYHLLLIPFTWGGDLRAGAKVGTVLFAAVALFGVYWLVLRYRIRYPLVWLLALLACSWMFYVRVSMTRASGLSILFIVAGLWLLFERRYVWLVPAAFLYVWTYNLFVMLLVLVVLWAITLYWSEKKIEWRPILWASVGTVAGFVIHPYFPRNVHLFWEHLRAKSGAAAVQGGGGFEWYSLPAWDLVNAAMIACAAMVVGYLAFGYALGRKRQERRYIERATLLLLFASFLLLITLRSVRFMEYWPPFAVLFAAFSLQAVWDVREEDNAGEISQTQTGAVSWPVLAIAVVVLAGALVYNLHTTRMTMIGATKDPEHYKAATQWMQTNLPAGALIYDINWSDFPKLFYYDTTHNYVSGLDPLYLADRHPELERLHERLSLHQEQDPAGAIRSQFAAVTPGGVNYVFVGDYPAPPPPDWFAYIMRSGGFARVYQDPESVVLQVLASQPVQTGTSDVRTMDNPEQRKAILPQVHRRFGQDVYATDEENVPNGPALVIHNKQATEDWARRVFTNDSQSISGELLWQLGFHVYAITNGKQTWAMEVKGNPKFRSQFAEAPAQAPK